MSKMFSFSWAKACWKSHQPCFPCAWVFLTVIYCCPDELSQSTWYHSNIILRSDISLPHLMKVHWKIDFSNVIWVGYTLMRDITLGELHVMIYPQSRLFKGHAPGTSRCRTTNHSGVVAVTPDRPWSIPIITWLNNVILHVLRTKYVQNHHQIERRRLLASIVMSRISQGVQWSGKSQGNSRLGKSQGKVREFCWRSGKKWILGKVREKSGSLHLVQSK